jgi:hypothetical protein
MYIYMNYSPITFKTKKDIKNLEHFFLETTRAPTTRAPTTRAPTTRAPTTRAPTTRVPTTRVPTTRVPTTRVPTTRVPTTRVPTTVAPTTRAPTTRAPTTVAPTKITINNNNLFIKEEKPHPEIQNVLNVFNIDIDGDYKHHKIVKTSVPINLSIEDYLKKLFGPDVKFHREGNRFYIYYEK